MDAGHSLLYCSTWQKQVNKRRYLVAFGRAPRSFIRNALCSSFGLPSECSAVRADQIA